MNLFNKKNIVEEIAETDRRILPIYFPTPITLFSHHIFPLAILLSNENFSYLLMNYYIQLSYKTYHDVPDIKHLDIDYFPIALDFYPNMHFINRTTTYLKITELNNKEVEIKQDLIIDKVIKWIDNGYYLYFNLDESQIPGTFFFRRRLHYLHPIFIFGYDKSQKILRSLNYDENRNVSIIDIKFEDFTEAFLSPITKMLLNEYDWGKDFEYVIILYKRKDNVKIELNPAIIRNSLQDFITSGNFLMNYALFFPDEDWMKWGIETYDTIQLYLNSYVNPQNFFDYRIFFCLFEHKKLMSNRIYCLEKNNLLNPAQKLFVSCTQIEEKTNVLKTLSYKYFFSKELNTLEKIKKYLMDIKNAEEVLLNNLLLELDKSI